MWYDKIATRFAATKAVMKTAGTGDRVFVRHEKFTSILREWGILRD